MEISLSIDDCAKHYQLAHIIRDFVPDKLVKISFPGWRHTSFWHGRTALQKKLYFRARFGISARSFLLLP